MYNNYSNEQPNNDHVSVNILNDDHQTARDIVQSWDVSRIKSNILLNYLHKSFYNDKMKKRLKRVKFA